MVLSNFTKVQMKAITRTITEVKHFDGGMAEEPPRLIIAVVT